MCGTGALLLSTSSRKAFLEDDSPDTHAVEPTPHACQLLAPGGHLPAPPSCFYFAITLVLDPFLCLYSYPPYCFSIFLY